MWNRRYRRFAAGAAGIALVALSAACSSTDPADSQHEAGKSGDINTVNTVDAGDLKAGGTATYTITLPISNWNVLNAGGATYSVIDIANVLQPSAYILRPDNSTVLNTDLLKSAKQVSASPQTVEYQIQPDATWSDGEPITADDFKYNWQVQDPAQCPTCEMAVSAGYDRIKSVDGSADGKTVTVVFKTPYSEWQSLYTTMLPAHVAAKYGSLDTPAGLATSFNDGFVKNVPDWSGGPFMVKDFTSDGSVLTEKNPKWYGTPSKLDSIVFRLISNPVEQPTALRNGEADIIFPTPGVDLVKQVQALPGVKYQLTPAPQVRYMYLNMNSPIFKDKALRQAIFEAIDVDSLVHKTIGQFDPTAKPVKDHLFLPGTPGYADEVSDLDYGAGDTDAAVKLLEDAGYTGVGSKLVGPDGKAVPTLRMPISNANSLGHDESQLIKSALAPLGITVYPAPSANPLGNVQEGTWEILDGTVSESPFVASTNQAYFASCPADVNFCNFNIANYKNPQVDTLLSDALSSTDPASAQTKLEQANKLIAGDYAVMPLYQQRFFLAYKSELGNVRNAPAFPTYNSEQWGFRK
jgi:peptide/nickel transport system substrate-binding protein